MEKKKDMKDGTVVEYINYYCTWLWTQLPHQEQMQKKNSAQKHQHQNIIWVPKVKILQ